MWMVALPLKRDLRCQARAEHSTARISLDLLDRCLGLLPLNNY